MEDLNGKKSMEEEDNENIGCINVDTHKQKLGAGVARPSTSHCYDFVNVPFDADRGDDLLDIIVAVIDSCRARSKYCDKSQITFLNDPSSLVDYRAFSDPCPLCSRKPYPTCVGISGHGFYCASIIASRKMPTARMDALNLGAVRGIAPPPYIALYATGCACGFDVRPDAIVKALNEAVRQGAKVISISLADHFPDETSDDYHFLDLAILEAFGKGVLTVKAAGNIGKMGLRSIAKSAPWCLTVGSCTPKGKYMTKVSFGGHVDSFDIMVESLNAVDTNQSWFQLRKRGKIEGANCLMYLDSGVYTIEPSSEFSSCPPCRIPIVSIPSDQSWRISEGLRRSKAENEMLCACIEVSVKVDVAGSPFPSAFSSRGPCKFFKDFMKPDICAPGEEIAAAWPKDEPVESSFGPLYYTDFNVLDGTSCSTPQVAAAVALLCGEHNFSAPAAMSAVITTAKKMHGKDRLAREFAYGAGMLDLKRATRPGFVMEESMERYAKWFEGSLRQSDLNLPYMSKSFPIGMEPWHITFHRKARSLENEACIYTPRIEKHSSSLVLNQDKMKIDVNPKTLMFKGFGDEKTFSVTVRLPNTWVETNIFGMISMSVIWQHAEHREVTIDCPLVLSATEIPPYPMMPGLYTTFIFQKPDPDMVPPITTPILPDGPRVFEEATNNVTHLAAPGF